MNGSYDFNIVKNNWSDIKEQIKKSIKNSDIFNDFIRSVLVYGIDENNLILSVKNELAKKTINNNYLSLFTSIVNKTLNANFNLRFLTNEEIADWEENFKNRENKSVSFNKANTNQRLSFNSYVVSQFNKNAYNALKSILDKKLVWNPIFISSNVGLGKTHLLNAFANEYLRLNPNANVYYVTSDEFIREIYHSLQENSNKNINEVIDKYESVDVLLIDDVQFLATKEKISEIFFNIFNHNIAKGKIVIMSSDKHPDQMENFHDRMKSRFSSGLCVEISKPSIESICQILEMKINEANLGFIFPKETILYIARRNQSDIRKLNGYLNQILHYAFNNLSPGAIISINIVQTATKITDIEEIKHRGFDIDPNIVIEQVCLAYGVDPKEVKSKSRLYQIANCRSICMYVLRKKFDMKYEEIGKFFSNRNHSTVITSIEKVKNKLENDKVAADFIEKIYKNI